MASATPLRASPLPRVRGQARFFIAGATIALAVAYLVVVGLQSTTVYFLTVSELQDRGASVANQTLRVSGNLVPGTFARDASGTGVAFAIADPAASRPLAVAYRGQVPDIVGDDVEIIAEGRLDGSGTFQATQVLAKCPSRLENASPEQRQDGTASG